VKDGAISEYLEELRACVDVLYDDFKPTAAGATEGASWKDGLAEDASLKDVAAHAGSTLLEIDGPALHAKWKKITSEMNKYKKALNKYKRMPAKDDKENPVSSFLGKVDGVIKQGRVTISEALILEALVGNAMDVEHDDVVDVCMKQKKELLKVEAPHTMLQTAIFKVVSAAKPKGQQQKE